MNDRSIMTGMLALMFTFGFEAGFLSASESVAPLGMVLSTSPEAQLLRGGESREALLGDLLHAEDVLEGGERGLLFISCPLEARLQIHPGSRIEITEKGYSLLEGAEPQSMGHSPCTLPRVALGEESLERIGGMRPRGAKPIVVFTGGSLSTGRPDFEWLPVEETERYLVFLRSESGDTLWERTTPHSYLDYPPDEETLEPGWYSWEVIAEKGQEVLAQRATGFEVQSPVGAGAVQARGEAVSSERLLLGAIRLENAGFYSEAAEKIRALLDQEGRDSRLARRLASLYWKAGLLIAFDHQMKQLENPE